MSNGLGSPLCSRAAGLGGLSAAAQRDCDTSGFLAARAPTSNYAFDVNIESGVLGINALALFQYYILAPVWMALVWVVHALLVMLEWCYTLDLLDSGSTMGEIGRELRRAQATFTEPWLVIVLAVASMLTLYHGLIRRQVAQSLGQALLTLAMTAGGLWMIANPAGTVGALGEWTNQASLGTLAAITQGSPSAGVRPLGDGMRTLFAYGIEGPWCFMEFGDVRWCNDPALLDARLRQAGLRMAHEEQSKIGCSTFSELLSRFTSISGLTNIFATGPKLFPVCAARGSEQARAYTNSAAELQGAQTNRELFLALPANGLPRNSVSTSGALLNILCGSGEMKSCSGSTAAQAEFRGAGATGQRAAGLLMILIGAVGMVLVLGFVALHLLGSALLSLLYLLMAPAAVLAPALGDGGRAVFRGWATRLLGAIVSKLLFSLLLGTLLLMVRILLDLRGLGWWTQWLLVSVVWWGAWRQRHQAMGFFHGGQGAHGAGSGPHAHGAGAGGGAHAHAGRASLGSTLLRQALPGSRLMRGASWIRGKLSHPAPDVTARAQRAGALHRRAQTHTDEQVGRMLEYEHGHARQQMRAAPQAQAQIAAQQSQLARVRGEHAKARDSGDRRRELRLQVRAQRIEGQIAQRQQALTAARRTLLEGERARRSGGRVYPRASHEQRAHFLDAQAALPSMRDARTGTGTGTGPDRAGEGVQGGGVRGAQAARTMRASGGRAGMDDHTGSGLGAAASSRDHARPTQQRDYAALVSLAGYSPAEYHQLSSADQRQARLQIDRELALRRELHGAAEQLVQDEAGPVGRREQRRADRDLENTVRQRMSDAGHDMPSRQPRPTGSSPGQPRPTSSSPSQPRPTSTSPVMQDIHEVAQRRKRQLGRPARR